MALLPIIHAPDARLKIKCSDVESVDQPLRDFMDDMLETMYAAPGVGLSAPQVGVTRRVIVCDVSREDEDPRPLKLINPEVIKASEELTVVEEGCLSFPEHFAEVKRPNHVLLRYLDEFGEQKQIDANGLLSTCLQHEIDHLEGILYPMRMQNLETLIFESEISHLSSAGEN